MITQTDRLVKRLLSEMWFNYPLSSKTSELCSIIFLFIALLGLSERSLDAVWQRVSTLELLLDKSNDELRQLIQFNPEIEENEILRWQRAMFNLKRCHQSMSTDTNIDPFDFSWTYWNGIAPQTPDSHSKSTEADTSHVPFSSFKRGPLIAHRFTKKFRALSTCDFCHKQMFFGLKCIECKYSCHKDCEASVPPSCGVPPELMSEFKQTFNLDNSNSMPLPSPDIVDAGNGFFFSTRANNSKKSSNAGIPPETTNLVVSGNHRRSSSTLAILKNYFEELSSTSEQKKDSASHANADGTNEVRTSKTISYKSTESNSLSGSLALSMESTPSDFNEDRQSEWGIKFEDIKMLDVIGSGRFGIVKRAQWHGDVAVKILNANYLDDAQSLNAFKLEIATFKNTRHDNLILFMGFCMEPQAIITSLCKGNTLHTHIHLRRDKFNLYRAANYAQQISNGMSYLHAKDILHKDLTTKNIFLENCKIVITDFGLFSATKLRYNNGLHIPNNWLCYLAPELIRSLKQTKTMFHDEFQFSKQTDVYAFGTIWYEILSGEFPFKGQPPHSIIFQIGCGMKQTLANLQATREVKDILMLSWAYQRDDRRNFNDLLILLKELPKKQMPPRAPTRKVHLSLSAESVF